MRCVWYDTGASVARFISPFSDEETIRGGVYGMVQDPASLIVPRTRQDIFVLAETWTFIAEMFDFLPHGRFVMHIIRALCHAHMYMHVQPFFRTMMTYQ